MRQIYAHPRGYRDTSKGQRGNGSQRSRCSLRARQAKRKRQPTKRVWPDPLSICGESWPDQLRICGGRLPSGISELDIKSSALNLWTGFVKRKLSAGVPNECTSIFVCLPSSGFRLYSIVHYNLLSTGSSHVVGITNKLHGQFFEKNVTQKVPRKTVFTER